MERKAMNTLTTDSLEECRKEIEEVDRAMARLFHRRMDISRTIGRYKKDRGLPIRDLRREEILMERNMMEIPEADREAYCLFFQEVLVLSRACQEEIQEGAWTKQNP